MQYDWPMNCFYFSFQSRFKSTRVWEETVAVLDRMATMIEESYAFFVKLACDVELKVDLEEPSVRNWRERSYEWPHESLMDGEKDPHFTRHEPSTESDWGSDADSDSGYDSDPAARDVCPAVWDVAPATLKGPATRHKVVRDLLLPGSYGKANILCCQGCCLANPSLPTSAQCRYAPSPNIEALSTIYVSHHSWLTSLNG